MSTQMNGFGVSSNGGGGLAYSDTPQYFPLHPSKLSTHICFLYKLSDIFNTTHTVKMVQSM
jgi:hypothetical protein